MRRMSTAMPLVLSLPALSAAAGSKHEREVMAPLALREPQDEREGAPCDSGIREVLRYKVDRKRDSKAHRHSGADGRR